MNITDPEAYVDHFAKRVVQDAYAEASATYWRRRARALEAALPRPGDFMGHATTEDVEERRQRLAEAIHACYVRAGFSPGGEVQ